MKTFCSVMFAIAMITTLASAQTVTLGIGSHTNGLFSYPAPYGNYWGGARHQMVITAAELMTAGASAGNIVALELEVVAVGGAPL